MTVSTGIYTYPFEVDLPESSPTSCEGKYGFIRYLASVNVVRPNQPVQTQTVAFTVIKTHNLVSKIYVLLLTLFFLCLILILFIDNLFYFFLMRILFLYTECVTTISGEFKDIAKLFSLFKKKSFESISICFLTRSIKI